MRTETQMEELWEVLFSTSNLKSTHISRPTFSNKSAYDRFVSLCTNCSSVFLMRSVKLKLTHPLSWMFNSSEAQYIFDFPFFILKYISSGSPFFSPFPLSFTLFSWRWKHLNTSHFNVIHESIVFWYTSRIMFWHCILADLGKQKNLQTSDYQKWL